MQLLAPCNHLHTSRARPPQPAAAAAWRREQLETAVEGLRAAVGRVSRLAAAVREEAVAGHLAPAVVEGAAAFQ